MRGSMKIMVPLWDKVSVRDVGDKIPPQAIRRMGIGFFRPIEGHLLAEGEGECSTQVEPSPAEHRT
jgi:hypothetical protein